MIVRSCAVRRTLSSCLRLPPPNDYGFSFNTRPFQTSASLNAEPPNHYETLNIPTNASPKDIKKCVSFDSSTRVHDSILTTTQVLLHALQSQPPRSAPQRSLRLPTLRPNLRSLRDSWLTREETALRSRLPPHTGSKRHRTWRTILRSRLPLLPHGLNRPRWSSSQRFE